MPTSYIHTNTFNLILQNISVTGNNKALTDFQESLNRRKLHTPIVMMTWAPVVPKRENKMLSNSAGSSPQTGCTQPSPLHLGPVFIEELGHNLSDLSVFLPFNPCSLSPWPFGESGIPSMSDSCQVTPALSMGSCSAEPIQDLEI